MFIFITGIPTSGKSYLSEKLEKEFAGKHVELDDLREDLINHPIYGKWVSFYYNKNEKDYLEKVSSEEKWNNLVKQSEELWPALKEEIDRYKNDNQLIIFESVNLLPHLVQNDYPNSKQIVLIGESLEFTFERNRKSPRWGKTEELQKMEAEYFFNVERPRYRKEAEKYNLPIFTDANDAFKYIKNVYHK
jgi:2-phosphoglycerate kinase